MLKTNLILGFMLIMLLAMSMSLMAQSYSGGSGTLGDPYQLATTSDLITLSNTSIHWTSKYFIQTGNISFDANEQNVDWDGDGSATWDAGDQLGFSPIGNYTTSFTGSYDGNDKTIDELYIDRSADDCGLFGEVRNGGIIKDLSLTNVDITNSDSNGLTGALIGQCFEGTITNCTITGSVTGIYGTGGLIGQSESSATIQSTSSSATVSGGGQVGGLIGSASGTITNSYARGDVIGTYSVGGLFGMLQSNIDGLYSTGDVTGTDRVGGLIGQINFYTTLSVQNCYSIGNITRSSGTSTDFGGFCGELYYSGYESGSVTIQDCYSIGDVNCGSETNKGFVGSESSQTETYQDNFWDSEASNQSTATGATAKTTAQMKTENFVSIWGWSSEIWERIGYNYPRLIDNPDPTLPVTLSAFTAQYIESIPTLCWTTQSESNNAGWNIYRGENEEALSNEETYQLNLSLGLIPGAGSTSEPTEYSFEDVFPVYQGNTYFYWLESVDYSGESEIYGPISLTIPENEWQNPNSPEIPKPYGLHQNYPNPFNPNTEISFMMKENCIGELSIYNIKGQKIKILFTNESIPRDELIISCWNGKDESGKEVSTGVYYYKLRTTKGNFVRKMILMK